MSEKTQIAYEDLPFAPLAEGSPIEIAMLWGNPETGPAAIMVRLPAGHVDPFHSHSSTYHSVVIKGSFQTRTKGADNDNLPTFGSGSYALQPGGEVHAEVNAGADDVVALVYFDGPVDFNLDE